MVFSFLPHFPEHNQIHDCVYFHVLSLHPQILYISMCTYIDIYILLREVLKRKTNFKTFLEFFPS